MTWLMNNIEMICAVLGLILTCIGGVFSLVKGKDSKAVQTILKVVKKFPEFIRKAEKMSDDGEEKKSFVLDQAILNCKSEGVELSEEQLLDLSERIDEEIKLSKDINLKSKNSSLITQQTITIKPLIKEQNNDKEN